MEVIEIQCPCCKAAISVSSESGEILRHEPHKKGPAEFGDFMEKQKRRTDDLKKKFEESKEKSKQRLKSIQDKIDFAKSRLEDEEE